MTETADLFDDSFAEEPKKSEFMSIIPTSVIDVLAQGARKNENHNKVSSRSNYSPFPNEVISLCYEMFLKRATDIFDPFAGWGERHDGAKKYSKNYVGFDVSEKAIENAKHAFGVKNILADSRTADLPKFNGLITCPPYWNLERYDSDNSLCNEKTFDSFIEQLKIIFGRCYSAADSGTTFCIVAGDWRAKGIYFDLEYQICSMFKDFGSDIIDKVILSRKAVSKIKIMLPQCKRLGYTVKVHETLLVFKKSIHS